MNLLDLVYAPAAVLLAPLWLGKRRIGWRERFGSGPALPSASRKRIMLHAVSVGEVSALRGLVPLLTPQVDVVISAGTDTGLARARDLFGREAHVIRYPLDFSACVRRVLDRVRPDVVGLVELEVWPNFIAACASRGIPIGVINGRLSARSFRGYRRGRFALSRTFGRLAFAAVQDDTYRQRFIEMGVAPDRCFVTDTMKWDHATLGGDVPGAAELGRELGIDPARPLVVAGSTADALDGPEEALLHATLPPGVQLLCAPRKPERFDLAASAMPGCVRRSQRPAGSSAAPLGSDRFLLDTIGELRKAYALADVVVLGRSFGRLYGSDPIEPCALGKATVIGPKFGDFETVAKTLVRAGAMEVTDAHHLREVLAGLLANPQKRGEMGRRGMETVRAHQGASQRHARLLLERAGANP